MSKRPAINLADLTAEAAAPMTEAMQRAPHPAAPAPVAVAAPAEPAHPRRAAEPRTRTANLQALAFKVSPAFRKRFKQRATNADLKLNELLFEALDAWEEKRGIKR
jgi:hypothetical protein